MLATARSDRAFAPTVCRVSGGGMTGAGTPLQTQRTFAAALVAGYFASVLVSFVWSRAGGQTSSVWTASGFLVGALILLSGRWRVIAVALSLGFQAIASLAVGDGFARAL